LDYSESVMEKAIARLPSGEWEGKTYHDPFPGMPEGGLPLRVRIRIDAVARRIELDLRDNPDCMPNGMNQSATTAMNNAIAGVCFALGDVPLNSGSFRRLNVLLRENCVAGIPVHPTSCSMSTGNVGTRIVNMTQAAFAAISQGYGLGEGANGLPPSFAVISGIDARRNDEAYVTQLFFGSAGGPGGPSTDGWLTYFQAPTSGAMHVDSVEADEQKYPLIVRECRIRRDSEGEGWHRGAPGTICVWESLAPLRCTYSLDGHDHPAAGVLGGGAGGHTRAFLMDSLGATLELTELVADLTLLPGQKIVSHSGGGGGYGDPFRRDPLKVLNDVKEGYVSVGRARDAYGVVIVGEATRPEALEIDAPGTMQMREPRVGS
jgi:N-methylhydantoinase B/oxoprolinase/acetone carboxylase alpha subunit